jgi:hypothetical protein
MQHVYAPASQPTAQKRRRECRPIHGRILTRHLHDKLTQRWAGLGNSDMANFVDHALTVIGHLIGFVMRWIYPPSRMHRRILCVIPDLGPVLYINKHQEALTGILIKFRNGLPFKAKFESIVLRIALDSRQLGTINHQTRFELARWGGETTVPFDSLKLSAKDVDWVRTSSRGAEMICLNAGLNGQAYFKTWFGDFELPINLAVRVFVDLRNF